MKEQIEIARGKKISFTQEELQIKGHSIEVRVPFVDRVLVDDMTAIPPAFKLKGTTTKYILKKAGERLLPPHIIWRKKSIFTIPTRSWLRGSLRPMVQDTLSEASIKRRGLFRPEAVHQLLNDFRSGREDHHLKVWALLTLELWMRNFFDSPSGRD